LTAPAPRAGDDGRAQVVLAAAFDLFCERGYEHASMDAIARRANVAKPTIYALFAGKEDILAAGIARPLSALSVVFDDPRSLDGPHAERVAFVLHQTVEIEVAHLSEMAVLLALRGNTPVERRLMARWKAFEEKVTALVGSAIDAGEIRRDASPLVTTRLLLSLANWLTAWYRPSGSWRASDLGAAIVKLAFDGLARTD
jgi:AcrR family transcriptional regulator